MLQWLEILQLDLSMNECLQQQAWKSFNELISKLEEGFMVLSKDSIFTTLGPTS